MKYLVNKQILAFTFIKTVLVSSFKLKVFVRMLFFFSMTTSSEEIKMLRAKAEASLNKTAQLQQALAQLEATLSRKENQKLIEKSQNI